MGFFSSWFQQPAPAASTTGAAVTSPTEAAPPAIEEEEKQRPLYGSLYDVGATWDDWLGTGDPMNPLMGALGMTPEYDSTMERNYAEALKAYQDFLANKDGYAYDSESGQWLSAPSDPGSYDDYLLGQMRNTNVGSQLVKMGATPEQMVQFFQTYGMPKPMDPGGGSFFQDALQFAMDDVWMPVKLAMGVNGAFGGGTGMEAEYLSADQGMLGFGGGAGGGALSGLPAATPMFSTPANTTLGLDGTPQFSTPAMTTMSGEGLPFSVQTGALSPGMLGSGAAALPSSSPSAAADVDTSGITMKDVSRYARLAKSVEAMLGGGPQDAPQRADGQSDQQYADQLAGYMGLDAASMADAGLMPGSPQYYEYIMSQADAVIEQVLAGVDVDSADLAAQLRGKTAQEMQALQRALYVRGAMQQMMGSGTYTDPVSGRGEDIIAPGQGMFNPGVAAYQRGLARNVDELAGMRGADAMSYLDDLLGRSPDMYGMQASADDRYAQALLEQQEDPRRKRGMFSY